MLLYKDLLSGDELLSDAYDLRDAEDGFFYEVEGKWQEIGDTDVDIGANPSAEGGDDEGAESTTQKAVDLIFSFRLQEQPSYDKKAFMAYVKPWLSKVIAKLPAEEQEAFKAKAPPALKFLQGKIKELQFFLGESLDPEATMVYAYYKEGSSSPTFLYPKYALKEEKL